MLTLNETFSHLGMRRRYEVWFLRLGLANGSGAWWFRYLLMNPGRAGCSGNAAGSPVQVWATWFPREGTPLSFIQGFPLADLEVSARRQSPFFFRTLSNAIEDTTCLGNLDVDGHQLSWNLRYTSRFRTTLSNKGWIGFSCSPHSDAVFSGEIHLDDRIFRGNPLGFGVQGHNCGYRHRHSWTWTHAFLRDLSGQPSTFEALTYEMPFGLTFSKAVLRHDQQTYVLKDFSRSLRDRENLRWEFEAAGRKLKIHARIAGSALNIHRLPYLKTDCSGSFAVANNSLANARIQLQRGTREPVELTTRDGAVLEMVG